MLPNMGPEGVRLSPVRRDEQVVILSIHPRWVQLILSGEKTIELRRRGLPARHLGGEVVIYETRPTAALVATCKITEVIRCSPEDLWSQVGDASAVPRNLFDHYFDGCKIGFGLKINAVSPLPKAVPLTLLREKLGWHPPVYWGTLPKAKLSNLL